MTNEQILKDAIEKAMKNGYMPIEYKGKEVFDYITISGLGVTFWKRTKWNRKKEYPKCGTVLNVYSIIFSHDFAKAFWGEKKLPKHLKVGPESSVNYWGGWQFHLQQMVLEENPLSYLERFL